MQYSDESYDLRIELDTKGFDLSAETIAHMEEDLDTLRKLVADFPVSNLYITIVHHSRSDDFHVKTSLALPGKTLFTGERDGHVHPAYERCVRKLVKKVETYKRRMSGDAESTKLASGTRQALTPTRELDTVALNKAIQDNDYARFRQGVDMFEEGLTVRIGRWIQRYPEVAARLGDEFTISDIVEDVFLNAFEQFAQRSNNNNVPPGVWFEGLIDPTVQALLQSPDDEFANISFARSVLKD